MRPHRGFLAAVAEFVRTATSRRRVSTPAPAPFDSELHLTVPFALLTTGPR